MKADVYGVMEMVNAQKKEKQYLFDMKTQMSFGVFYLIDFHIYIFT